MIFGVSEEEIRKAGKVLSILPKDITWGNPTLTREQLEDNLIAKIRPRINGLRIQPVRKGEGSLEVIFLIDIPRSDDRPHMTSNNRYYRRLNFEIQPMEHYEVADPFRMKWASKEKLVEKIYDPLSQALEKHSNELLEYSCPSADDIEQIMAQTYYKFQMPYELIENIDYYLNEVKKLRKNEYNVLKFIRHTLNKHVLTRLGKSMIHQKIVFNLVIYM